MKAYERTALLSHRGSFLDMIDKKTVFVLGAGASCPYGYPSGSQLREEICLNLTNKYLNHLNRAYPDETTRKNKNKEIKFFIKTFNDSTTKSIDLFLARNPHLAETGKNIIAYTIFDAEIKSNFRERSKHLEQDWYFYLFDRLTDGVIDFKKLCRIKANSKVSFITFNYDRSLEQFLYESFQNSFTNVPSHEIVAIMNDIEIIHMYGCIAPLDWQDREKGISYKTSITESLLNRCSSNIKTIYEQDNNSELDEVELLLEEAEQVFYLGFGYAEENMDILKVPEMINPSAHIYGTAFKSSAKEIQDIVRKILTRLKDSHVTVKKDRVNITGWHCLELLKEYL